MIMFCNGEKVGHNAPDETTYTKHGFWQQLYDSYFTVHAFYKPRVQTDYSVGTSSAGSVTT